MKTASKFVICYDHETGGLPSKVKLPFLNIPLVETAMVVVDMETLEICEEVNFMYQYNYKEDLEYSPQAEEVHGISKQIQDANGLPLKEIYKAQVDLFKKYKNPRQGVTLAGHNATGFDFPFSKNFFEYMGGNIEDHVKYQIDTMQFAHMAALEQTDYKLGTCCNEYNIDLVNAHRGLDDTRATAQLFIEFVKRLRGVGLSANNTAEKTIRYRETFQL